MSLSRRAWMGLAVVALLMAGTADVRAHGGGLDAQGCHTNRKTGDYHCHRGASSSSSNKDAATVRNAVPVQPSQARSESAGGPTCYTGPRGGTYTITPSGRKNYSGC
jgi:hypothetical protein